jgi:hypothetical protein
MSGENRTENFVCWQGDYSMKCTRNMRVSSFREIPALENECSKLASSDCYALREMLTCAANTRSHENDSEYNKDYENFVKGKKEGAVFRRNVERHITNIFQDKLSYGDLMNLCTQFGEVCKNAYDGDCPANMIAKVERQHVPAAPGGWLHCSALNGKIAQCRPQWVIPELTKEVKSLYCECRNMSKDAENGRECKKLSKFLISAANSKSHRRDDYFDKSYIKFLAGGKKGKKKEEHIRDWIRRIQSRNFVKMLDEKENTELVYKDFIGACKKLYDKDYELKSKVLIEVVVDRP